MGLVSTLQQREIKMFNSKLKSRVSDLEYENQGLVQKIELLEESIENLKSSLSDVEEVRQHISELQASDYIKKKVELLLNERQKEKLVTRDEMKASNEPYFEFLSERYDPATGQVEIQADWNVAFIEYLKKNGFEGNTEEDIFYQYLRAITHQHVVEQMQEGYE